MAFGCDPMRLAPADYLVGTFIIGLALLAFIVPPIEWQGREIQKLVKVLLVGGVIIGCSALVQLEDVASEQKLVALLLYPQGHIARKRLSIRPD
jgi:hypothetical protein